jgi:putative membrane protein
MISFLTRLAIAAAAVMVAAYIVPGIIVTGLYAAVITALVLGVVNILVRPVLVILTLPITILTLGLFLFVINAALLLFVASFVEGFAVEGFVAALLGSVLISVVTSLGNKMIA